MNKQMWDGLSRFDSVVDPDAAVRRVAPDAAPDNRPEERLVLLIRQFRQSLHMAARSDQRVSCCNSERARNRADERVLEADLT